MLFSEQPQALWRPLSDLPQSVRRGQLPTRYSLFTLDQKLLEQLLKSQEHVLTFPWPDNKIKEYIFEASLVMHPQLKKKHTEIKTFKGSAKSGELELLRFDISPRGLYAQIDSQEGLLYIMPIGDNNYISFFSKNYIIDHDFSCDLFGTNSYTATQSKINYGSTLRTYKIAIATTSEYTAEVGGTPSLGLASVVSALNFINGIFEKELSISLQLVPGNERLIFTNALTDPYTPSEGNTVLVSQNQSTIDSIIGFANYDVGHLFDARISNSNISGGVARVASVCKATKAHALTRASRVGTVPINPRFYRTLAHELGHQFGAHHTFNANCNNRHDPSAYEPGSGSTLMSYAGKCGSNNIQLMIDMYFHRISLESIAGFVTDHAKCGTITQTGNAIPIADAGPDYHIPRSTPFALRALASDANTDNLSYSWEQYNNEIAPTPQSSSLLGPNFRSFVPAPSSERFFPRLAALSKWEVLPSVARTMNFSLVVRDNVGGASADDMIVTIDSQSDPFVVTSPNGGETRRNLMVVNWDPAQTALAPINAKSVRILLSLDNGLSYPYNLAQNAPNDGSHLVKLPRLKSTTAKIQVRANDNIFYDVSNGSFTIVY
jgi:hypothetical protein